MPIQIVECLDLFLTLWRKADWFHYPLLSPFYPYLPLWLYLAQGLPQEWISVAEDSNIQEDYHGFYDDSLEHVVDRCLENMLTETNPRPCIEDEAFGNGWLHEADSPIRLVNWAWQIYERTPAQYFSWKSGMVKPLTETYPRDEGGSGGVGCSAVA